MNWDGIGAVGEIVGAFAVAISVFYLAAQIKKQTAESALSATRDLAGQHLDLLKTLATDEILPGVWLKGVKDYDALDEEERLRLSLIFHAFIRNFEQQFIHAKSATVESAYTDSINREFSQVLSFRGFQQWWGTSKSSFDDEFVTRLDKLVSNAKEVNYESTFRAERASPPNNTP